MKKIVLITLALLVAASLGCFYADDASDTATETYPASPYDRLEIETGNGEITSSVSSDSVITITLTRWVTGPSAKTHLDDINVIVTTDSVNGVLRIFVDIPTGAVRSYGCDADIGLPEELYVNFVTSNGRITVQGHQAGLYLETSNGAIDTDNTAGEAELVTDNGEITVDIHVGDITGRTSNGAVDARVIMLKTETETDTAYGHCIFTGSNGYITLAVPDTVGAEIRLETSNGNIEVDPDLPTQEDYNSDANVYESKMGDESGEINLETSNGDVTLKKL